MLRNLLKLMMLPILAGMLAITSAQAQELQKQSEQDDDWDDDRGEEYYDRVRIDRYLNVEIWTDHDDDEYYEGDRVRFNYRVSRDAFVAIYTIDSKGRVNLLFPSYQDQDNYVSGGVTHTLPGRNDDYDLVVSGPEGVENVQIIASKEPIPIPDWYNNSGLFCDWEDRHDYMDWVNAQYFVRYEGQRFAYDRTSLYIYEWEPTYFRPVYRPYYPNWTVCGNVYVDYWPGSSIYIDGIFWGITPCYIPRIYVGWHTFTVYDRYNYCWEYDVHVTRYNTVVLDHTVIVTQPTVRSKYKTVRYAGYQVPTKAGYTDYNEKVKVINSSGAWKTESSGKTVIDNKEVVREKAVFTGEKKFVQGSAKVVKTERGIETAGSPVEPKYDGGKYKRSGSDNGNSSRKSVGQSNDNTHGSIYKRRDSYNPPSGKPGSTSEGRKSNLKKSDNPARKSSNDGGSSGTYKKSSNTPSKKSPSVDKSSRGKADDNSSSKVKKASPPSQKSDDNGGKKSNGSTMKVPAKSNPSSGKAAPAPSKSSGSTKSSSVKGKGGRN
jgi:hypothetical protein